MTNYLNWKKQSKEVFKYSVNEEITGKIWIDGKPIYRKTLQVLPQNISTSQEVAIGVTIGDYFKVLDGGCILITGEPVPLPFSTITSSSGIQASGSITKDKVIIETGSTVSHIGGWITLEYTKA